MGHACVIHKGCRRIAIPGSNTTRISGIILADDKKACTKCGSLLPASTEYFYRRKNRKGGYGLTSRCKACTNEDHLAWRKKNPAYFKEYDKKRPEEERKAYRAAYNEEHKEEIRERSRKYRLEHAEERSVYNKQYRNKHREKLRQYGIDHKEERNAAARRRRRENPEKNEEYNAKRRKKWREDEEYREKRKTQSKIWRQNNREWINEYCRKRYAEKKSLSAHQS